MKGKLAILSGPSGVGKDALLTAAIAREPRIVRVVTYTTRAPRTGEVDGRDYHFVSLQSFFELADGDHFFEHKNVFADDWYASPKTDAEALEAEGKIAVLKIDVEGAMEVMKQRPEAVSVFVLPPSFEVLEQRIRDRATDTPAAIEGRLQKAAHEISFASKYAYQVVNDDLSRAVEELTRVLCEG